MVETSRVLGSYRGMAKVTGVEDGNYGTTITGLEDLIASQSFRTDFYPYVYNTLFLQYLFQRNYLFTFFLWCYIWTVADEFASCDFGDVRLLKRVQALSTSIANNPELSIHAACSSASASKAAYRFLQNYEASNARILKGHMERTLDRMASYDQQVLVIQDTTALVYTQFPSITDIGELSKVVKRIGRVPIESYLLQTSKVTAGYNIPTLLTKWLTV